MAGCVPRASIRSIPACAGEPPCGPRWSHRRTVYPRVCGGTLRRLQVGHGGGGLSPRVRGNRRRKCRQYTFDGSIPACAGEPMFSALRITPRRVYPRVCGGTRCSTRRRCPPTGLSPRVRGNRKADDVAPHLDGSIPACAGEPDVAIVQLLVNAVYPRVCGGTADISAAWRKAVGLSPRVRGNHVISECDYLSGRSIPACAGEPRRWSRYSSLFEVYPRVCGGTRIVGGGASLPEGLSPRVRGNRALRPSCANGSGSIPACAGEPRAIGCIPPCKPVYPRVCGGTSPTSSTSVRYVGLSPRVRGNLAVRFSSSGVGRSIPACAGEPTVWEDHKGTPTVYPRVCGGTA